MTQIAKRPPGKPSHLKALLRKNWILWKRSWCVSLLEILVPFLFALLLVAFRAASPPNDIAQTTYYDKSNPKIFDGTLDTSDLKFMKSCTGNGGGVVALAPPGDSIVTQLEALLQSAGYAVRLFDNSDAIDTYTARNDYTLNGVDLCFGIVIDKNDVNNKYQYSFRWNVSGYNSPDIPKTADSLIKPISTADLDSFNEYAGSGVLVLQNVIDNIILRTESSTSTANIKYQIASRTVQAYTDDKLATNMKGQTRLFLDLPLLLIFLRFVNGIMREKEKRIREGMKIMGLRNSAFYASWFITYSIIFSITSFLVSGILTAGLFKHSNWGLVFLWHLEFSICYMFMGFLLTVFFSKAKTANVAGFVISLVLGFIQSALGDESSSVAQVFASLAPQTSMGLSADFILSLEAASVGLKSNTVNLEVLGYRMTYHYIMMFIDIIIFFLLGAYLDQVFPSEFGVRKHPLFCLMRKKKSPGRQNSRVNAEPADESSVGLNSPHFEEADPHMRVDDEANQSVMVKKLRKVYGNGKLAVDDVSFNMYKGQIFALLGHNGAGKTSTISMITGLYTSTSGTTSIFGMDVEKELDSIRQVMGICPQHDILFDELTVKEHLEMFAVFKGMNAKDIPKEVEKTILDIGLAEKRDYPSKNLSGGQKRKLSIGIAFIGGSKFILLDEPSSGMDTSARRKLWDMLKNNKHDRVILLTTHFMDEADYLGDRIGIMAEGQLKCMGRPLFLKNKFGIGYNLTLVKEDINDPSQPIKDIVHSHIPESKVLSDVSAEVAFQLPLTSVPKFQALFDALDKDLKKLKISTYGVSVTTLEEVFLNVAKINAPEKHFQKEDEGNKKNDDEDLDSFNLQNQRIKSSFTIFWLHFWALVIKRIQYFKRDKKGLVCELVMPILMIIIGIVIAKSLFGSPIKALSLDDNMYEDKFRVDYNNMVSSTPIDSTFLSYFNTNDFDLKGQSSATLAQFDTQVFNDQGKDIIHDPVNIFSFYVQSFDTSTKTFEYVSLIDTRAKDASVFSANKINNAIIKTATGKQDLTITTVIHPFAKTTGDKKIENISRGLVYSFVFAIGMSFIPASVITYIVKEREANAKHQQIVSGVSIAAYWFSNFFVDMMKYLVPGIINPLIAMAFNTTALIDGDKLGALWALFLLYGFCVIPFVYLSAFLFKDYGTAQIACFFFNFGTGFIGGLAVSLLRLFSSTRSVALALQWVLRPLPTFAMTYGFLDIGNREIYSLIDGVVSIPIFSMKLVGGDILFLIVFGVFYMGLVFLVEYLKNVQSLAGMFSGEKSVPYVPKEMDEDVKREMLEVEKSDDKTYSIKVDKLRKVYKLGRGKHKVAVDQISFGVKNGECFALLGTNGAGKTTTFKMLSGDYIQTSGKAQISGFSLPKELSDARYEIGYCPQFDALLENLTAREHLELYAKIKGIPENLRARFVEKQLREMNLKQYENVLAGTYSGGNKRKLSVAIAMIGNPTVVFLDEPSTGMDPEARRFMWNVISRISTERKLSSIILTTHSMEEAEALATKMGIMVNGGLKCLGTTQHIKNKYGGGYEIEIKTHLPPREQVTTAISSLNRQPESNIGREEVDQILDKLNASHLKKEISENGSGSALYNHLKIGTPTVQAVVEWALIELNGETIKATLTEKFGPVTIIEHFQTFFRFKVLNKITIGNFFGLLEQKKDSLNIQQYSVRQSTIEQIFNTFAEEEYSNVLANNPAHVKLEVDDK